MNHEVREQEWDSTMKQIPVVLVVHTLVIISSSLYLIYFRPPPPTMKQIPGTENYVTKLVKRHTTATYAIIVRQAYTCVLLHKIIIV